MKKFHPIVYLALAYVVGIMLAFKAGGFFIFLTVLVVFLILTILLKKALSVSVVITFLLLGLAIGSYQNYLEINNPIKRFAEKQVTAEGLVNSDVVKKNRLYSFNLAVNKLNKKPVNIQVKAYVQSAEIAFGNYVHLSGKVKMPEEAGANKYPMIFVSAKPQVSGTNYFWHTIGSLRAWIKRAIIPSQPTTRQPNHLQSAAFTYAMLTGQTSDLSTITKNDLTVSGLAHIWSVSGLHTGFLVFLILMIFRLVGLRSGWQLIFITLILMFFCAFTGLDPPVIRASIMAIWLSAAYLLGRKQNWLPSIAAAALISLAIDPQALFEASFQLSYAAIISLCAFTPKIANLLEDTPSKIRTALAAGISAQILPLPVIAFYYGQIPLYSPAANMLAIPIAGVCFYLTIGALLLKTISLNIMWLPNLLSQCILLIGRIFAALPLSTLEVSPLIISLMFLTVLFAFILIKTKKPVLKLSYFIIGFLVILAIGFWGPAAGSIIGGPQVTAEFIDVGQGDATLITGPNQERVLIDGGPKPYLIERALMKRRVRSIDLVVATHADADHMNGLIAALTNFKVKAVLDNGFPADSFLYRNFRKLVKAKNVRYILARKGQQLSVGKLKFKVLNPPQGFFKETESDENNNSIVLQLEYHKKTFLFMADTGFETENSLLRSYNLRSTVLKVGHHGSSNNTSSRFLKEVKPIIAVIEVGRNNMYGHPTPTLLRRLSVSHAKIYRTDLTSDIKIIASVNNLKAYE